MVDQPILTAKEQEKLSVIGSALENKITNSRAAKMLDVSTRQIKRLKKAVRANGALGIIHKLKGRQGNRCVEESVKEKVITLIQQKYSDFKPTFATEKLTENHQIILSPETIRLWMIEKDLWKPHKQRRTGEYRSWRPRKEYFGELQQFDGSYHHWFENRYCNENGFPIEACLLASIDDATGRITKAEFSPNEGVMAVFNFWKEYVLEFGKPVNIYLDRFSTYKINHKSAVDNHDLITQFQRAMLNLVINLIPANSPQAKGRIERLFQTLQDRLIKEMRLADIKTPEEGNRFLKKVFIPQFNRRFAVIPAKEGDVHKALSEIDKKNLNRIFSAQSARRINNDFTIQFKNNWHQLAELQPTTIRAKDTILAEEWLDGTIHFSLREKYLNYAVLPERPKRISRQPLILTTHKLNWIPPVNHPWRQYHKTES